MKFFIVTSINFVMFLAALMQALIFLRVVLSFFVQRENKFIIFVWSATEPLLSPVRRLLPNIGGFDFSPVVVYFAIHLLSYLFVLGVSHLLPVG